MFKVVCINDGVTTPCGSKIGAVYEVEEYVGNPRYYQLHVGTLGTKECYLKLPTEPKTCADMTMEEYLAVVCLRESSTLVTYNNIPCSKGSGMPYKSAVSGVYSIDKPKSPREIEIERITEEIRKLADDLERLKAEEK